MGTDEVNVTACFDTGNPVTIEPEKKCRPKCPNLYKRHQKTKRARSAVEPLLER